MRTVCRTAFRWNYIGPGWGATQTTSRAGGYDFGRLDFNKIIRTPDTLPAVQIYQNTGHDYFHGSHLLSERSVDRYLDNDMKGLTGYGLLRPFGQRQNM